MTATTSTLTILRKQVAANPTDTLLRLVYADALQEAGQEFAAIQQRDIAGQQTAEGTEVVTVGRDGADTAGQYAVIFTTKIYRAARRADGMLTWRLVASVNGHRTAGKTHTGPMIRRAKDYAVETGREFRAGVCHGYPCS